MDAPLVISWIGVGISLTTVVVSTWITVWSSQRQRAADLVAAALAQMGGGSQNRSAALAALMALRGPTTRPLGGVDRRGWATFGPAVGQQLYRQLVYVLNQGGGRHDANEVETVMAMTGWLLQDPSLRFIDRGQRHRLAFSMRSYLAASPQVPATTELADTPLQEFLRRMGPWIQELEAAPGGAGQVQR